MGLLLVGFIGGLLTGISPCIIPVLPVIFFSGGTEAARPTTDVRNAFTGRRPYLVIVGLVVSFSFFTLAGSFLLSLLQLPQSTIIWIGIVFLVLIGVGLIVPRFERILEKPFAWIPQRQATGDHGGFLLGIALGAVFVPCAGPVLALVVVAGAKGAISADTLLETLAFAIGVAIPLLIFALAGRRLAERVAAFRRHQRGIRVTAGIVMIALAAAVVPLYNLPGLLLQVIPDYTSNLQAATAGLNSTIGFGSAKTKAGAKTGSAKAGSASTACAADVSTLVNCGTAPEFTGIDQWFNTANDKPITLKSLRGKVVLVDFWAYSCINCQRSTPHLNAWYKSYAKDGFVIVGVHAPEYAFEHVPANVLASAKQQGIKYPIALDNEFDTWTAYGNQYWPAEYLIDATGQVRHVAFGEGDYSSTENLIRTLLKDASPSVSLPKATDVADTTPTDKLTPETYLGSERAPSASFLSPPGYQQGTASYTFPSGSLPLNDYAFSGAFTVSDESVTAANGSSAIRLHYEGSHVYLNVGGTGTLTVTDSAGTRTIPISGAPDIHDVLAPGGYRNSTVTIKLSSGLSAYSFTFG
jgi:cytochrome c biogenesis protein CcdA/thiol-disulfide isomerase/thioredoxin